MLQILHKGNQISVAADQTGWTGNAETDSALAVVTKMKAGRVAAINAAGAATLADGAVAGAIQPLGLIVNDAAGYFYENKPALASAMIAVALLPGSVFISDQIDATITFVIGSFVYCGTGASVGLLTNTIATGARPIGIALSAASAAAPELTFAGL